MVWCSWEYQTQLTASAPWPFAFASLRRSPDCCGEDTPGCAAWPRTCPPSPLAPPAPHCARAVGPHRVPPQVSAEPTGGDEAHAQVGAPRRSCSSSARCRRSLDTGRRPPHLTAAPYHSLCITQLHSPTALYTPHTRMPTPTHTTPTPLQAVRCDARLLGPRAHDPPKVRR